MNPWVSRCVLGIVFVLYWMFLSFLAEPDEAAITYYSASEAKAHLEQRNAERRNYAAKGDHIGPLYRVRAATVVVGPDVVSTMAQRKLPNVQKSEMFKAISELATGADAVFVNVVAHVGSMADVVKFCSNLALVLKETKPPATLIPTGVCSHEFGLLRDVTNLPKWANPRAAASFMTTGFAQSESISVKWHHASFPVSTYLSSITLTDTALQSILAFSGRQYTLAHEMVVVSGFSPLCNSVSAATLSSRFESNLAAPLLFLYVDQCPEIRDAAAGVVGPMSSNAKNLSAQYIPLRIHNEDISTLFVAVPTAFGNPQSTELMGVTLLKPVEALVAPGTSDAQVVNN